MVVVVQWYNVAVVGGCTVVVGGCSGSKRVTRQAIIYIEAVPTPIVVC